MDAEERQQLEALLQIHRRNLRRLELTAAELGTMSIPTNLHNEIEREKLAIVQIESQLSFIPRTTTRPANAGSKLLSARYGLYVIFDAPESLARSDRELLSQVLEEIVDKFTDYLFDDPYLKSLMDANKINWELARHGWEEPDGMPPIRPWKTE